MGSLVLQPCFFLFQYVFQLCIVLWALKLGVLNLDLTTPFFVHVYSCHGIILIYVQIHSRLHDQSLGMGTWCVEMTVLGSSVCFTRALSSFSFFPLCFFISRTWDNNVDQDNSG